jgi:coatomer subunit beta
MHTFLVAESNSACKPNAVVFLAHCSMPKAVEYILSIYDSIGSLDEAMSVIDSDVIRLDCKNYSTHRVRVFLWYS